MNEWGFLLSLPSISNFTRASNLALFRENTNFSQVIISIYLRVQSHIRTVSFSGLSNGCQTDVTKHVFAPTLCKLKNSIFCRWNKPKSLALRTFLAPSALTQSTCGKSKSTCVFFGNPPRALTKMKPYLGCHFFSFQKRRKKKKERNNNNNNNKITTRKEEITYTFFFIIYFIISLQINIFVLVACVLERNCRMRFMGPK